MQRDEEPVSKKPLVGVDTCSLCSEAEREILAFAFTGFVSHTEGGGALVRFPSRSAVCACAEFAAQNTRLTTPQEGHGALYKNLFVYCMCKAVFLTKEAVIS